MKKVIKKDGVLLLHESEDEKAVREARARQREDLELLLHGSPGVKELSGILQRSLIRLLALEREQK